MLCHASEATFDTTWRVCGRNIHSQTGIIPLIKSQMIAPPGYGISRGETAGAFSCCGAVDDRS